MLRLFFIFAIFVHLVVSLATTRHLEGVVPAPAFGIRPTFATKSPRQISARAVLTILKRQNTCGAGFCGLRGSCCGSRGCCPGGASCCGNGSCCEAGTLCTADSQGVIGCCPEGQTCAGSISAGGGGDTVNITPSDTTGNGSPTTINPTPSPPPILVTSTPEDLKKNGATNAENAEDNTKAAESTPVPPAGKDVPIGTIIGAVVGGILGWLAICAALFWFRKRNTQNKPNVPQQRPEFEFTGVGKGGKTPRPYTTLIVQEVTETRDQFANPMPPLPVVR